jgi:hypothetical protein
LKEGERPLSEKSFLMEDGRPVGARLLFLRKEGGKITDKIHQNASETASFPPF